MRCRPENLVEDLNRMTIFEGTQRGNRLDHGTRPVAHLFGSQQEPDDRLFSTRDRLLEEDDMGLRGALD
jgi:hypothetical protein